MYLSDVLKSKDQLINKAFVNYQNQANNNNDNNNLTVSAFSSDRSYTEIRPVKSKWTIIYLFISYCFILIREYSKNIKTWQFLMNIVSFISLVKRWYRGSASAKIFFSKIKIMKYNRDLIRLKAPQSERTDFRKNSKVILWEASW